MGTKSGALRALCTLSAILLFAFAGVAQEFRGQISGTIYDPSGAMIPGAQITITNVATNVQIGLKLIF